MGALIVTVTETGTGTFRSTAHYLGIEFQGPTTGALMLRLAEAGMPDRPWEARGPDGQLRMSGGSTLARAGAAISPGTPLTPIMVQALAAFKRTRSSRRMQAQAAPGSLGAQSKLESARAAGGALNEPHEGGS